MNVTTKEAAMNASASNPPNRTMINITQIAIPNCMMFFVSCGDFSPLVN